MLKNFQNNTTCFGIFQKAEWAYNSDTKYFEIISITIINKFSNILEMKCPIENYQQGDGALIVGKLRNLSLRAFKKSWQYCFFN